ncbi:unnamed protein product [Orchesella dallaii]|uniref:DUF4789 domain-containing protein n=1 Tax=Orchesella dallaii TaxID=48710 RepID=A0ABP1PZC0_9HEXA
MLFGDILFPTIFMFLKHATVLHSGFETSSSSETANPEGDRMCVNLNKSSNANLLFHPETSTCYENESKGPCGENMKLYSVDGKVGECDCEPSPRMLIFHKKANQCFPIFQKGPCKQGKWIDVTQEGFPTCKLNPCYTNSSRDGEADRDLVMLHGTCVEVEATSVCEQGFKVGFESGKRLPRCIAIATRRSDAIGFGILAIHTGPVRCSPGTYKAISGKCQPAFEFDY